MKSIHKMKPAMPVSACRLHRRSRGVEPENVASDPEKSGPLLPGSATPLGLPAARYTALDYRGSTSRASVIATAAWTWRRLVPVTGCCMVQPRTHR